ncbi:hypothetical protein [Streptomyces sp. NPDC005374]|uniref:hypothetical protein n=1 Tax=Streptomyces sp. NPDC005374 TaxID=3364713 RepID=UPI003693CE80
MPASRDGTEDDASDGLVDHLGAVFAEPVDVLFHLAAVPPHAKALLETGEVVRSDTTPATTRATPGSRLIGLLSRRAEGEGVL